MRRRSFDLQFSLPAHLLLVFFLVAPPLAAARSQHPSDHTPARVLADVALHRFWQQRLAAQPAAFAAMPSGNASLTADQGNLAVLEADNTVFLPANSFDLDGKSLLFTRNSDGTYRVAAGNDAFDSGAAQSGVPLALRDDDTFQVTFGFSFPFYGQSYGSVFLNSDGNLTFTQGDVATSARDLARFLVGVPRIAPFFADLNPFEGGQVTVNTRSDRVILSWVSVPLCCVGDLPPPIPRQTFQAVLFSDGRVEFIYAGIQGTDAVVGLSPGRVSAPPGLVDLSLQSGTPSLSGAIAEVFSQSGQFSALGVARKFYQTHEDAYDYLVIWANFAFSLGPSAFAFEENVRNEVLGIGPFGPLGSTFDFTAEFGSPTGRLQSVVQMGFMGRYPSDPTAHVPGASGPNSTLTILGQEAGHRWLVNVRYPDGQDPRSKVLLGRDDVHWSFYYNSEASVVEGNEIRDNGDGSFTTVDVVRRYGSVDQYVMGLLPPEQVPETFVVTDPSTASFLPPRSAPQVGRSFRGTKLPVTIDKIVQANGRRLPSSAVAQKNFNFAFILVTQPDQSPSGQDLSQLDNIRTQWEQFWQQAAAGRARASTSLVKAAKLSPLPVAVLPGTAVTVSLNLASPAPAGGVTFNLAISAGNAVVSLPASVTVASGATSVTFTLQAATPGTATVTASAAGYETAAASVDVTAASSLAITAVSGDGQTGRPGQAAGRPLIVVVSDPATGLPAMGVTVQFNVASGGGTVAPASAVTDAKGRAQTSYTLGPQLGAQSITASLAGASAVVATFTVTAVRSPAVGAGGTVSAASFRAGAPLAAGSIAAVFGSDLAVGQGSAQSTPLPLTLAGASLQFNSAVGAPLFFASPNQVNLQIPWELAGQTQASLLASVGGVPGSPVTVNLGPFSPGIFTIDSSGGGQGAIVISTTGEVAAPSGSLPGRAARPASRGDFISIFSTGLGEVTNRPPTGAAALTTPLSMTTTTPAVTIGAMPATTFNFSGLAPFFVGLYQVNVQVPANAPTGNAVAVVLTMGSTVSNTVTIAVQ